MSEKTITREEFMVAVIAMREVYCGKGGLDTKPELYAQAAAEAFGIMVDPESVVPGSTGGEWFSFDYPEQNKHWVDSSVLSQVRTVVDGKTVVLAQEIQNPPDGKVMAGSKALVEKVVAMLKTMVTVSKPWSKEVRTIIGQLEEMNVDVSEF